MLDTHIKRVEKKFVGTEQLKQPDFDFQNALYISLHKNDEFYTPETETKEMIYAKRMREFERTLKYRKKYLGRVIQIAEKWKVKMMDEDQIPHEKLTILKCEGSGGHRTNVFIDFKKRKFWESLSLSKNLME